MRLKIGEKKINKETYFNSQSQGNISNNMTSTSDIEIGDIMIYNQGQFFPANSEWQKINANN